VSFWIDRSTTAWEKGLVTCLMNASQVLNAPTYFGSVVASGPTLWTSTYGLELVLCNRLLIEPSGWAQTVHMFT